MIYFAIIFCECYELLIKTKTCTFCKLCVGCLLTFLREQKVKFKARFWFNNYINMTISLLKLNANVKIGQIVRILNCPSTVVHLCQTSTIHSVGRVGPVAVHLTADQEVPGWNPTLAWCEFFWTQEMNLQGSTQPKCELVSWECCVCVSLILLGTVCWLNTNRE